MDALLIVGLALVIFQCVWSFVLLIEVFLYSKLWKFTLFLLVVYFLPCLALVCIWIMNQIFSKSFILPIAIAYTYLTYGLLIFTPFLCSVVLLQRKLKANWMAGVFAATIPLIYALYGIFNLNTQYMFLGLFFCYCFLILSETGEALYTLQPKHLFYLPFLKLITFSGIVMMTHGYLGTIYNTIWLPWCLFVVYEGFLIAILIKDGVISKAFIGKLHRPLVGTPNVFEAPKDVSPTSGPISQNFVVESPSFPVTIATIPLPSAPSPPLDPQLVHQETSIPPFAVRDTFINVPNGVRVLPTLQYSNHAPQIHPRTPSAPSQPLDSQSDPPQPSIPPSAVQSLNVLPNGVRLLPYTPNLPHLQPSAPPDSSNPMVVIPLERQPPPQPETTIPLAQSPPTSSPEKVKPPLPKKNLELRGKKLNQQVTTEVINLKNTQPDDSPTEPKEQIESLDLAKVKQVQEGNNADNEESLKDPKVTTESKATGNPETQSQPRPTISKPKPLQGFEKIIAQEKQRSQSSGPKRTPSPPPTRSKSAITTNQLEPTTKTFPPLSQVSKELEIPGILEFERYGIGTETFVKLTWDEAKEFGIPQFMFMKMKRFLHGF